MHMHVYMYMYIEAHQIWAEECFTWPSSWKQEYYAESCRTYVFKKKKKKT